MKGAWDTFRLSKDVLHTSGETSYLSTVRSPADPALFQVSFFASAALAAPTPNLVPKTYLKRSYTPYELPKTL